jgi:hypothetical protein
MSVMAPPVAAIAFLIHRAIRRLYLELTVHCITTALFYYYMDDRYNFTQTGKKNLNKNIIRIKPLVLQCSDKKS